MRKSKKVNQVKIPIIRLIRKLLLQEGEGDGCDPKTELYVIIEL